MVKGNFSARCQSGRLMSQNRCVAVQLIVSGESMLKMREKLKDRYESF